ncbi:MAG: protein-L-isoaspartate(D-aspartate) O-methyltransferase [Anaerolineae bacterium]
MSNSNSERHIHQDIIGRGITDQRVLSALRTVPRELFVLPQDVDHAYDDKPLSIGYGQTISQPYIVALMTGLLHIMPDNRILEIGTGSGYQAAILSRLCAEVYSIEVMPALYNQAVGRLNKLLYQNLHLRLGDGYHGWSEYAPFNGIIVTCAPDKIPDPLLEQLTPDGRMIIPVGPVGGVQELILVERGTAGYTHKRVIPVSFVPLIRS